VSIIKHKTTPGTIIENINMLFTHHKQTARIIIAVRRMLAGSAIMNSQDNTLSTVGPHIPRLIISKRTMWNESWRSIQYWLDGMVGFPQTKYETEITHFEFQSSQHSLWISLHLSTG
jgi:hypothetical protein